MDVDNEASERFYQFANLPIELRRMIWRAYARIPQLARWGRGPASLIFHVNQESRSVAQEEYIHLTCFANRDKCYGFYMHPARDTLLYMTRFLKTPRWIMDDKDQHKNLFQLPLPEDHPYRVALRDAKDMNPQQEKIYACAITKIAIPLDDAFAQVCGHPHQADTNLLWNKLEAMFPHVEELICVLFPNPHAGDRLEDFSVIKYPPDSDAKQGLYTAAQNRLICLLASHTARVTSGTGRAISLNFMMKTRLPS
ncbi:hypothetical protein BJ875DRAFT_484831 [Amylocarpus encephaloides]|uniref:2EXR domain-containing protein n=1 Tax=Amylocarpus encephaloides TaxID=45428 RepID=A0A9P8C4Q9_9HELO|nr:hypothetical protein BJ875DRAFT_484831 [Amylocarpus encephaloides]